MPEGERGDDREEIERGLNDIETTRERIIGGSAGTEEQRYKRREPDINGQNQASRACQRWRGEFRGSSALPWSAAAAAAVTLNQVNRKKRKKREQSLQRHRGNERRREKRND